MTLSYDPDGDHSYGGWDRFGRVVEQSWRADDETLLDGYAYTYDRSSNRLTRTHALNDDFSEAYAYDGLDRLIDTNRDAARLSILESGTATMDSVPGNTRTVGDIVASIASQGKTPIFVAIGNKLSGIIGVGDVVKSSSQRVIGNLKGMGLEVVMITGDNPATARAIAAQVGIDTVIAGVLPQEKWSHVKPLQTGGRSVAMVGDGINDAPALAQADVSIAMGSGTDVAMEAADITLMQSDLSGVPEAIALSKRTMLSIKQNLLEMNDSVTRLRILAEFLKKQIN